MSLTRQQDLPDRPARQVCPAGLPSRPPLLVRQAFSAGRQACSAGLPSRPPLQVVRLSLQASSPRPAGCPAGYLCLSGRLSLQAGRLVQQVAQQATSACPAGFLCRPAGLSSRLAQQATPAGRQASSASLLSRLVQQACPADYPCRPAGKRTGFFLKTSSARLLPQDFLFKTSSSRSPEGGLSPVQALPCCSLQHVFSNLQCSNYYIRRP